MMRGNLTWDGGPVGERLAAAGAEGLMRAALFFEKTHKQRLSKSNPRPYDTPSKPGEYPRLRTGHGRAGVQHEPTSLTEVARLGYVRVGYLRNVWYMLSLETRQKRLGLLKTLQDLLPQLRALAGKG